MYGYVVPEKTELTEPDFCLYRAFYCGICKALGRNYGQLPRFTTNYDMVFMSVLMHEITKQKVEFETKGCVLNPFKKKTTVCGNPLLDKLVATNIILGYYKADDDVIDGGGAAKKMVKKILRKPYNKAKALVPEIDEVIKRNYDALYKLEKERAVGVDRVAHCFGNLLSELAGKLLENAEEPVKRLCYNVGKFVYLADALDDVDEDFKKKRYNVLLTEFPNYNNRKQFIADNESSLSFIFATTVNRAIECFNAIACTEAYTLLRNIVYVGLRKKTEELLKSEKKLIKPRI